jgi:hypothetical protein
METKGRYVLSATREGNASHNYVCTGGHCFESSAKYPSLVLYDIS